MSKEPEWVVVATFRSTLDAEMTEQLLVAAGIPTMVHGEQAGLFGPGFPGWLPGQIGLSVPTRRATEAKELIVDTA